MRFRRHARLQYVEEYIIRHLRHGPLHFTLLDPDRQSPKEAGEMAKEAADAGSHAILVGGSTPEDARTLDRMVKAVKRRSGLPVILFPGGHTQVTPHADAVWFMCLLNSRDRRFLVGEQVRGAPMLDKMGMETLPMGYIVVAPGGTVGKVGQAELLAGEDIDDAVAYALAAQFFGMRFVYLEAGSGAETPVPPAMVRAVKRAIDIPLIVGGGLRTADQAHDAIQAGADIIVTGTLVEGTIDIKRTLGQYLFDLSERLKLEVRRRLDLGDLYSRGEDEEERTPLTAWTRRRRR